MPHLSTMPRLPMSNCVINWYMFFFFASFIPQPHQKWCFLRRVVKSDRLARKCIHAVDARDAIHANGFNASDACNAFHALNTWPTQTQSGREWWNHE